MVYEARAMELQAGEKLERVTYGLKGRTEELIAALDGVCVGVCTVCLFGCLGCMLS